MRNRRVLPKLLALAICGVLSALLLVVAALPIGLVAARASAAFGDLPTDLQIPTTAQSSYVYANDGKTLITTFYDENRTDVPLAQIAPVMQQAIVAAEDTRFYKHHGVDPIGIARALVANGRSGSISQGASTLTMQYVRNVLKSDPNLTQEQRDAATEETLPRKIQEARYALALEKQLSKQEILDRYLNIAYFGAGAYGIDAASRTYFGKPPDQLTLAEAALLAGIVQSPDADNPIDGDRDTAVSRRSYVLDSMVRMKSISADQAAAAKAEPPQLHPTPASNSCTANQGWGFFCDYFTQWWRSQPAFGKTVEQRENALKRGGYRVVTSLDPDVQAAAQAESLSVYGYDSARALPIAVVQPGTGRVLAMAVNRHYSPAGGRSNTMNQLIAGSDGVTGYQAGSTFKLFTMLAALEAGKTLDTGFDAPERLMTEWPDGGTGNCGGYYCPVNANPPWMDGYRTMWDGFGRSVNTYWVWLEEQIGAENAVAMAKRLGITFRADADEQRAENDASSWGSFTLGVADTTPLDLANAYATLGADGTYCQPLPVVSITDAAGRKVAGTDPVCHQAVSPDIARAATDAARCPVGQQSSYGRCNGGTATDVSTILGRPVAGKTGSTENNATETFVGFTPQIAAAAIAANPDDPSDYVGEAVSAAVNRAVARTMRTALVGVPEQNFSPPSAAIAGNAENRADTGGPAPDSAPLNSDRADRPARPARPDRRR